MSRKKKPPTIVEQMRSLIAQALEEKQYTQAITLINLLTENYPAPAPEKKKEE